ATIHSAEPGKGSGAEIWRRDVLRESDGPARLAAGLLACAALAPDAMSALDIPTHEWELLAPDRVQVRHRRTGVAGTWQGAVTIGGVIACRVAVTSEED